MPVAYRVDVFLSRDGELHRVRRIDVTCAQEAINTARAMVPTMAGAFAYQVVIDAPDKIRTITGLTTIGEIPDEYGASLFGVDYLRKAP